MEVRLIVLIAGIIALVYGTYRISYTWGYDDAVIKFMNGGH